MHIVTLSFDDGFRASNVRIASIHEKHGLAACFNVIASAHMPGFMPPRPSLVGLGDFGLWRELAGRGHEIMPHGYRHEDLRATPLAEAKDLTLRCLDVFERELPGFARTDAIYNVPYNASTDEMEAWLPTVVRAFRTWGDAINALPSPATVKLTCVSDGPGNCQSDVDRRVEELLSRPSGWLIYNTHGLDDEGWGPIESDYLDRLLGRLLSIKTVRVMPAGGVIRDFAGRR